MTKIQKLKKFIFRKWDKENKPPHPSIEILPPIIVDAIGYSFSITIAIWVLYLAVEYVINYLR